MRLAVVVCVIVFAACAGAPQTAVPAPAVALPAPAVPETITVRDPAMERDVARLKVQLLERTAELAEMDRRLGEATTEIVRAMARLRTLATRAEAASAIAEAEVALQQLRGGAGQQAPPEAAQAEAALRAGSAAFDAENYGGAVYLANQAKRAATAGRGRLAETGGAATRAGEQAFTVSVPLTTTGRANLRAAPSGTAAVVTTVATGTALTAYAHEQEWLRVTMADGRSAWIHQSLVRSASPGRP